MRHGKLSRDHVVALFGEEVIAKLDAEPCEPTSRLQTDGDDSVEYSATIRVKHEDYTYVTAYYYTTPEQEQRMADCDGDGSVIDWEIEGYDIG